MKKALLGFCAAYTLSWIISATYIWFAYDNTEWTKWDEADRVERKKFIAIEDIEERNKARQITFGANTFSLLNNQETHSIGSTVSSWKVIVNDKEIIAHVIPGQTVKIISTVTTTNQVWPKPQSITIPTPSYPYGGTITPMPAYPQFQTLPYTVTNGSFQLIPN